MGGGSTPSRALIQSAGGAFRLSAGVMKEEFDRAELSDLLSALSRDGIIGLRHPGSI